MCAKCYGVFFNIKILLKVMRTYRCNVKLKMESVKQNMASG